MERFATLGDEHGQRSCCGFISGLDDALFPCSAALIGFFLITSAGDGAWTLNTSQLVSLIEHRYMGGDLGDSGCDGGLTDHTAYTGQTLMSAAEQQPVPIFRNRPVFVSVAPVLRVYCVMQHET